MTNIYDTTVYSGETNYVYTPYVDYYTDIYHGGERYVYDGGLAIDTYDYEVEALGSGGEDEYTYVYSRVSVQGSVYSAGYASEPFVFSGGYEEVYSGGSTDYSYIYSGATQYNPKSFYYPYVYGTAWCRSTAA